MIFLHPRLSLALSVPRVSHLRDLREERTWELGWFKLCYRVRFSSAGTVKQSLLKIIKTFDSVMNNTPLGFFININIYCICRENGKDKTVSVTETFWSRSDSLRNLSGVI